MGEIAQKQEQGWRFIKPIKWMRVTLDSDGSPHLFNGKTWQQEQSSNYQSLPPFLPTTSATPIIPTSMQGLQNEYLIKNEDGEYLKVLNLSEELEVTGAYTETKFKIPHHSIVLAVNIRVIKPLQGASSFSVGTEDDKARYGSSLSSGQDTTNVGLTSNPLTYWFDRSIKITADNGSFTGGTIKISVQLFKPHGPWNWE